MVRHLSTILALAAPALVLAQCNMTTSSTNSSSSQLLISGSGYIFSASFDGTNVAIQHNLTFPGVAPSWLMQSKAPNLLIANDENAATTFEYTLSTSSFLTSSAGLLTQARNYTTGSAGIVHFAYNANQTRMFGAGYGSQMIDVWDTSAADGSLTFLSAIPTNNASSHPHQTVVSPAGNIAIVNDLGLDQLHILDTTDDAAIAIATSVPVPTGCGPRHGAFYAPPAAAVPSRYLVVCELTHQLLVFNMTAAGDALDPTPLQEPLQTAFDVSSANLTAAELLLWVNDDASADVYVSNRATGGAADSIAHFRLPAGPGGQPGDVAALTAADITSSGGICPRGMNLGASGEFLFVGNQQAGPAGLTVLARDGTTGALGATPVATVDYDVFAAGQGELFGPQFVVEWVV